MGLAATQCSELLHNPMKSLLKFVVKSVEVEPPTSHIPGTVVLDVLPDLGQTLLPDLGQTLLPHPSMAMTRLGSLEPLVSLTNQWRQIPKIVRALRRSPVTLPLSFAPSP